MELCDIGSCTMMAVPEMLTHHRAGNVMCFGDEHWFNNLIGTLKCSSCTHKTMPYITEDKPSYHAHGAVVFTSHVNMHVQHKTYHV